MPPSGTIYTRPPDECVTLTISVSAEATVNTPLAPSVEKAYYRKCIELKRRLNEVEEANDQAKIKRVRLDRAVMKLRLERAFLLEQLSKRMDPDVDASDNSADDGMATPPPDRPHRDKRKRASTNPRVPSLGQQPSHGYSGLEYQEQPTPMPPAATQFPLVPAGPGGPMVPANAMQDGQYVFIPPEHLAAIEHQRLAHGVQGPPQPAPLPPHQINPYGAPARLPGSVPQHAGHMVLDGVDDRRPLPIAMNGDRHILASSHEERPASGGLGFNAINQ